MGSSLGLFAPLAKRYRLLIETGTWLGDGIEVALEAGFQEIVSCDINEELVAQARTRFAGLSVKIYHGASEEVLGVIANRLEEPAVFFLDAHAMPPSPSSREFSSSTLRRGDEENKHLHCPIQREIDIILNSNLRGHAILVDDRQCFGTWAFHFLTEQEVREQVTTLCPGMYSFSYFQNVLCIIPQGAPVPRESFTRRVGRRVRKLLTG
jgi:hypothetical protein